MTESNTVEEKEKMEIRIIKLVSGEEVVTSITGAMENEKTGEITYACLDPAIAVNNPENPENMSFVPWVYFSIERLFHISFNSMVFMPKQVDEQIENEYKKYFARNMAGELAIAKPTEASPIIVPNKPTIIS